MSDESTWTCSACGRSFMSDFVSEEAALKDQVLELLRDPEVKAAVDGWLKERLAVFSDNLAERIAKEGPAEGWIERTGSSGSCSIGYYLKQYLRHMGEAFGHAMKEEMKE